MGRQIKFRGKTISGEWAYGYYLQDLTKGEIRHYIFDCPSMIEVIPETVGQFTGLYDATKWEDLTKKERVKWLIGGNIPSEWKGREIYEGDIVETNVSIGDIQFSHGVFGAEWTHSKESKSMVGGWGQKHNLRSLDNDIIVKVIGNIHDNKDLLTTK